jgi:hypothetical protein
MKIKKQIAISDSGFIFNPDTGESYSANPIGLEVLEMMKEGLDIKAISNKILARYNSDKDTVEKDFYDFIHMLHQYNLIDKDDE